MDYFDYSNGTLCAEQVPLPGLAERFGTPLFVYSRATLERHWHAFDEAFAGVPHLVCYAVKANSNLALLNVLARLGSGFDIVSAGELQRVLRAGGQAGKTVFSGVGKSRDELAAALSAGVRAINVESAAELDRISEVARALDLRAPVSLRVNPDVDPETHPYISTGLRENKFGVPAADVMALYRRAHAAGELQVVGMDCHIGSQLTSVTPYVDALTKLVELAAALREEGIRLQHMDVGGGIGIRYRDERPPSPMQWAAAVLECLADQPFEIQLEPGRAIAGNAGVLLTRVEYLKHNGAKHFAVVDAAMNDLLRPSLYSAWQEIVAVVPRVGAATAYDIVGPVCESSDFLGKDRELLLEAGDLLAVRGAGAYGFVMSSNYNSRPRAAEVMVDGERAQLVRRREQLDELMRGEQLLSD
ncbi:MAG: diaminopimelate decarboxylase [Gammaproteobacteria bacterium]|nr:diaminopimelate decarboxylase [Gammaproteobacteria bacterium]